MESNTCQKCGENEHLETHHISYIPEVTETLCKACNAKERRYAIKSRGFPTVKSYPQQGIIRLPKDILLDFKSDILEVEKAPVNPVAVLFAHNFPLEYLIKSLHIVLKDLELRVEHQKAIADKATDEGAA